MNCNQELLYHAISQPYKIIMSLNEKISVKFQKHSNLFRMQTRTYARNIICYCLISRIGTLKRLHMNERSINENSFSTKI